MSASSASTSPSLSRSCSVVTPSTSAADTPAAPWRSARWPAVSLATVPAVRARRVRPPQADHRGLDEVAEPLRRRLPDLPQHGLREVVTEVLSRAGAEREAGRLGRGGLAVSLLCHS